MRLHTRRTLLAAAGALAMPHILRAAPLAPLRVGNQKGGLRSLLEASGAGNDLPYPIEWSEFQAAQPLLEALNADAVDVGSMGDLNFFSVYANGAAIKAIGATRSSGASQAVIVPRGSTIGSVADLRGKRVAAARGGWTHYSLFRILAAAGVAPSEVQVVWMLPSDAAIALRSGSLDAWSTWEPFTSLEILQFGARVIADARGLTPSASVLAAANPALRDKRSQLADFVRRQTQGWLWARDHLQDYARSTARLIRLPEPVMERAYTVNDARAVPIDAALIQEFQTAVDRAVEYGIVSRRFDVAQSFDKSFLPAEG